MPYAIHVRGNSPASDNAAVKTAVNNLITALRALAGGRYVDAGGTVIDGLKLTADESDTTKTRSFGDTW